jgi:hypothetical protein
MAINLGSTNVQAIRKVVRNAEEASIKGSSIKGYTFSTEAKVKAKGPYAWWCASAKAKGYRSP